MNMPLNEKFMVQKKWDLFKDDFLSKNLRLIIFNKMLENQTGFWKVFLQEIRSKNLFNHILYHEFESDEQELVYKSIMNLINN